MKAADRVCRDVMSRDGTHSARAPIRIRTEDPFITNEVLYQLSYWGDATCRVNDRGALCKVELRQAFGRRFSLAT